MILVNYPGALPAVLAISCVTLSRTYPDCSLSGPDSRCLYCEHTAVYVLPMVADKRVWNTSNDRVVAAGY